LLVIWAFYVCMCPMLNFFLTCRSVYFFATSTVSMAAGVWHAQSHYRPTPRAYVYRYTIITLLSTLQYCCLHYEKVTSGSVFADGAIYFESALLVSHTFWPYTYTYPHECHSNAWFVNTFSDIQWVSVWKYWNQRATEQCVFCCFAHHFGHVRTKLCSFLVPHKKNWSNM
jgi:hypothetical protein